jgi:chorismate dehydratase
VKSILLISRYPIERLSGRKIALTNTSATSHVLLKLILSHGYGITPEYTQHEPSLEGMLRGADAALLIGDIALHHSINPGDFYLYDLGTEWKRLTGKKMVYAVWAVTRSFTERNGELSRYVFDIFRKSMDYSLGNLEEIAAYAAKWEPFSPSLLGAYFRSLKFDFGSASQAGLLHFYDMAAQDGHIERAPALEFLQLHPGVRA